MHSGPDPMSATSSFTQRRPNAAHLGNFELPPPPPMHKYSSFNTINAPQSSQAPTTIASVGNLLTPPNNIPGDVISPASGVSTSAAHSSAMPQYASGPYIYSPPTGGSTQYGYPPNSQHHNQYQQQQLKGEFMSLQNHRQMGSHGSLTSRVGLNPPPYEMNQQLPPFPPSSTPMGGASNLPTMSSQQQPHHMMSAHTPVSSSAPQQSPAHAQEPFARPPPTPTYYNSQPSGTPQQSSFPYSTGPSPTQQSPISAAGSMPRMSPAVSQGNIPSIQSGPVQSPHGGYPRPYGSFMPPAPVFSNVGNPNGQLALVGGLPHGMMQGFNSGHAASMPHMFGHPPPHQQPANHDRPFKCDQCPQSFNRNHDLKRHKRIHLAVKPFPCTHCDKSFSRKDALKRHILVKGCGKTSNNGDDVKRESHSPDQKSESVDSKPTISSHA
ncbi:hypothetical protein P154DRAFT_424999 [Amniculicola lignicola CBS 123094]|uniref:C2H2-type domain-containing protein n=1 Tax=Amniculicola lignicola CBS 123094 TaxID=1392246 RepID=A0A6A5WU36_9PLEO|nr:hypothetical protein P154DRAFT_424999 [Amniculicola lignicola CBS 123094]